MSAHKVTQYTGGCGGSSSGGGDTVMVMVDEVLVVTTLDALLPSLSLIHSLSLSD